MAAVHAPHTTTDHATIQRWAADHGARPARLKAGARNVPALRFEFPDFGTDDALDEISWSEFFREFDALALAFVYEDTPARGRRSNFNRFVRRY